MGVLYTIATPTEDVLGWLSELGIHPASAPSIRGPLLSEICEVLDSLEGYSVDYTDNGLGHSWQAMVSSLADPESGMWTLMNISRQAPGQEPQELWFEKGFPELIVQIVAEISSRCGPLVIIPDTGCLPLVVSPGDDPLKLCAGWEHLKPYNG